jgi:hypothetical protein
MQIVSVASAFPRHYYRQAVFLQALETYWGVELESPELLRRRTLGLMAAMGPGFCSELLLLQW